MSFIVVFDLVYRNIFFFKINKGELVKFSFEVLKIFNLILFIKDNIVDCRVMY